jgi:hypothetical protein
MRTAGKAVLIVKTGVRTLGKRFDQFLSYQIVVRNVSAISNPASAPAAASGNQSKKSDNSTNCEDYALEVKEQSVFNFS